MCSTAPTSARSRSPTSATPDAAAAADAPDAERSASGELVADLGLAPHPEGGWFREVFRSAHAVDPLDGRPRRSALTSIDFLLADEQFSAWHRVASDEAWHWLEGAPLRLWLVPPDCDRIDAVDLAVTGHAVAPRHVVPAGWWQAAEPLGDYAYVGATVGPGFDDDDFDFGRDDAVLTRSLRRLAPELARLL